MLPSERHEPWVLADQAKPGLERTSATSRTVLPHLVALSRRPGGTGEALLLELAFPPDIVASAGAPARLTIEVELPDDRPEIRLRLQWFEKAACRLPEAIWWSFRPPVTSDGRWEMEKLGRWLSPTRVVPGGNRRLHAVGDGVAYRDTDGALLIETRDAPLVAMGEPSLLNVRDDVPDPEEGIHVNLFNNVWGTNFPQWFGDDARFEIVLRPEGH